MEIKGISSVAACENKNDAAKEPLGLKSIIFVYFRHVECVVKLEHYKIGKELKILT